MNQKQDSFLEKAYADKDRDYYEARRPEMLALIPTSAKRVLDVGCGAGGFGAVIKRERGCEVWGLEPEADAAAGAATRLDRVIQGLFTEDSGLPVKSFDCIVFNDVLEHILDPGRALVYARSLLRDGGAIVASIPNIGHFPTVWRLAIRGEWEYTERGILDKTHLRFFTRSSIRAMFESSGYRLSWLEGINDYCQLIPADRALWRYYKLLSLFPKRGIRDMRYLQFGVQAFVA
jgi:SAM-dependent methyltransferase